MSVLDDAEELPLTVPAHLREALNLEAKRQDALRLLIDGSGRLPSELAVLRELMRRSKKRGRDLLAGEGLL